jgi:hypothetical protein
MGRDANEVSPELQYFRTFLCDHTPWQQFGTAAAAVLDSISGAESGSYCGLKF